MVLKIILFFIIFYYLFKLVARVFLPIFVKNRIRKMASEKENAYKEYVKQQKENEGKVFVTHHPPIKKIPQKVIWMGSMWIMKK
ncbi:hypothetical protein [Geofilum rubicundum]|uniref:Uncharacterized protein n=1 Tax=Geofilum rubicundum JCM 15548 TaxID=1236989 RepID=A0A0E9LWU1_9BACT|nr:hypothetical protein [Geofilum rubicundum]GAO29719.1 hypothetical protein JCM15548_11939 [Geofilum rubicundum JCM 15548]